MIRFKIKALHESLGVRALERRFTWDKGYTYRIQNRIAGKWVTCYQTSDHDTACEVYQDLAKKIFWERGTGNPERPEQPESAKEYCAGCDHVEMCRWYPYEGCEFRRA